MIVWQVHDRGVQLMPPSTRREERGWRVEVGAGSSAYAAGYDALEVACSNEAFRELVQVSQIVDIEESLDKLSPEESAHDRCEHAPDKENCAYVHVVEIFWQQRGLFSEVTVD